MFNVQFKAVFLILGNALLRLANLPASWKPEDEANHIFQGSATAYIGTLDSPAAGSDLPDATTNNPAQVFNSGADVAAVFQPAPTPAPASPPVYNMTELADGFTMQDYLEQGWTVAALLDEGYMVEVLPELPKLPPTPVRAPTPPAAGMPTPGATSAPAVLDSTGLPWDQRIHSGGRTMTTAGAWTKKKNVQPGIVAQVEAELRQGAATASFTPLAGTAQPPAPPAPGVPPAAPVNPPPAPAPRPPASTGAADAIAAAKAAASAAPTGEIKTFMDLCKWNGANNVNADQLKAACAAVGLAGFGQLAEGLEHPLIPSFLAVLRQQTGK